jgi:glycosyltransferase involved in cell wall biosynthesis
LKKITIITPCRNAASYIQETIESVLAQTALLSGRAELEYIICDGLSTDNTVEIAETAASGFQYGSVRIISQQDTGMYDALAKGLKMTSGDIVAYLNAGDFYNKHAFDIVLDIFETKKVQWLTGYLVAYNEKSYFVYALLPFKYRRQFFSCGFYGSRLPHVQQESTFWSSELNHLIDYDNLASFKYAGDFFLWFQFSRQHTLHIAEAHLGGFKMHKGQLSEKVTEYADEIKLIVEKPGYCDHLLSIFDYIIWYSPGIVKKYFNQEGLFRFNHDLQEWV